MRWCFDSHIRPQIRRSPVFERHRAHLWSHHRRVVTHRAFSEPCRRTRCLPCFACFLRRPGSSAALQASARPPPSFTAVSTAPSLLIFLSRHFSSASLSSSIISKWLVFLPK
ncbi:hypothetical protein M6B38_276530 [Iris pallida]|uniref:Uncharacterized protein n=1 Tax=Iris pallida TaxID=29817 RepID=A0AAX6HLD0_IRIPA|nr:hypothetical protein M6B38_306625 [Iris pallida]KAJ6847756.1 hypothetical protein M6B38_276530 [Iris pallida]